jgi:4-methylaminobutanoate oxidase (formaldehyde-forming)
VTPEDRYSFGRQNWFDPVGAEHRACRERVALFDQSSFAKFELRGKDAAPALDWICAGEVDRPVGRLIYTQMLNSRGGIECDLTVGRIGADAYYIVTGTGFRTHDFAWIRQNIPAGLEARLTDVTEDWATLSLMGPRSRDLLSAVSEADLSNPAFPFATLQEIEIAGHKVRALRITYMGELGWELHIPIDLSGEVYDALVAAGAPFGLSNAGYRALESLRLEKGYRAWGADITPGDSPFEAGLGWAVGLKSKGDFLGREAAEIAANSPKKKLLTCFTVDDPSVVLHGRETIVRNGKPVGYLSSAGWGYSVEKNIGYGYVRNGEGVDRDYLTSGRYELEVACERVAAEIHLGPLYDPKMERIKA